MMNATNKNKCVSWSNRVGLAIRQRPVVVAIAPGGLAILGIALTLCQAQPLGLKKSQVLISVSARSQSTFSPDLNLQTKVTADSQPQASTPTSTPDGELEVIGKFVLDGLEFAVAGAEVTNQFGSYRQIGNTVSWFAQELSQPEGDRQVAGKQPNAASPAAYPLLSPTEKEMATWLLQNSPWTHYDVTFRINVP